MRRPHDGQKRARFLHSSALLWIPDATIRKPIAVVITRSARTCETSFIPRRVLTRSRGGIMSETRVRRRLEIKIAAETVEDVRVRHGRGKIGVGEHILD